MKFLICIIISQTLIYGEAYSTEINQEHAEKEQSFILPTKALAKLESLFKNKATKTNSLSSITNIDIQDSTIYNIRNSEAVSQSTQLAVKEGGNFKINIDGTIFDSQLICEQVSSLSEILNYLDIYKQYNLFSEYLSKILLEIDFNIKHDTTKICLTMVDLSDILAVDHRKNRFGAQLPNATMDGQILFLSIEKLLSYNNKISKMTLAKGLIREKLHTYLPQAEYSVRDLILNKSFNILINSYESKNNNYMDIRSKLAKYRFPYKKPLNNYHTPIGFFEAVEEPDVQTNGMALNIMYNGQQSLTLNFDPHFSRNANIQQKDYKTAFKNSPAHRVIHCDADFIYCSGDGIKAIFRYDGVLIKGLDLGHSNYPFLNFIREEAYFLK